MTPLAYEAFTKKRHHVSGPYGEWLELIRKRGVKGHLWLLVRYADMVSLTLAEDESELAIVTPAVTYTLQGRCLWTLYQELANFLVSSVIEGSEQESAAVAEGQPFISAIRADPGF